MTSFYSNAWLSCYKFSFFSSGLVLALLSYSCKTVKIPTERHQQYSYGASYSYSENELIVELKNPLYAPLRVWIFYPEQDKQEIFNEINPVELDAGQDTVLLFKNISDFDQEMTFSSRLGSLTKEIEGLIVDFPFPTNKEYSVIQGNDTDYTHDTDWSRYAVDFDMSEGDTITSASNGYVVGVIEEYQFGGIGELWKPFSNYITIYEPESGVFIQYVHLMKNGSLVEVGDQVKVGQAIALSGNTGQSNRPHLHFNCLIPENSEQGLRSVPVVFKGGIQSMDLKAGDRVSH
ncbi:Murein DD-endopeptidase MepM and murein hydrolase activator NlpD, contain LysM domain [Algoriphagus faecimaris]|uniref:Murein DD-endopeptidase MepM and murein hydrolase activator NlpD, contain LysM domain n=1 Tax=Algoriphagus faecimaris TaxID=686796 RepID=A0A1G6U624_9BACT|nr:M23 family metallopeptidase [Algoriphagus faecimaris]SDD36830.1 Murein DD-endopeptidase MepM and murein hydrolase activator NlpD, contain LysM domain [Algoriphagus faecimaris]